MNDRTRTAPVVDDLVVPQGATWGRRWPLFRADGQPLNTTGWTGMAQARTKRDADAPLLAEWSTADGEQIITGVGFVELHVDAAMSAAWTWARGHYDLELTAPTGDVVRVSQGTITVDREVTR